MFTTRSQNNYFVTYHQGMLAACGFPLSVKEPLTVQNDLLIYPNPTKDILRIKLKKAQTVQVEVIDVSGKVMLSTTGQSESIVLDLSSFTNGLYVIKVTTKSATYVEKVIKK